MAVAKCPLQTGTKGCGVVEAKVVILTKQAHNCISTRPHSAPLKETNISLKITDVMGSPQQNSALLSQRKDWEILSHYCLRIHQKFFKNETVISSF